MRMIPRRTLSALAPVAQAISQALPTGAAPPGMPMGSGSMPMGAGPMPPVNRGSMLFRRRLMLAQGTSRVKGRTSGGPSSKTMACPMPMAGHEAMYAKGTSNVLSAKQRQALPRSSFALPGQGKGPKGAGSGSYPIPDKAHARAALSRGAQHASPAQLATIRRKVKAKFPGMKVGG